MSSSRRPRSCRLIVNVIEPEHGTVFDPACGSGGMFVQSSYFIERRGQDTAKQVILLRPGEDRHHDQTSRR